MASCGPRVDAALPYGAANDGPIGESTPDDTRNLHTSLHFIRFYRFIKFFSAPLRAIPRNTRRG